MLARPSVPRLRVPPPERIGKWVFRGLVWVVLVLLLLLGVRDVVRTLISVPRSGVATSAPAFPREGVETYATRFAIIYLTYDSSRVQARQSALQPYVAGIGSTDQQLGWDGNGRQVATVGLPSDLAVLDQHRAIVTVAVLVTRGAGDASSRWLYLAVPVVTDAGAFAIADQPALVPEPPTTDYRPITAATEDDTALTSQLKPNLTAFFKAYAASDQTQLSYYGVPGSVFAGLHGEVDLDALADLRVEQGAATTRKATALVRWVDKTTGARLTQSYGLTLTQGSSNWLVSAVQPAGAWAQ